MKKILFLLLLFLWTAINVVLTTLMALVVFVALARILNEPLLAAQESDRALEITLATMIGAVSLFAALKGVYDPMALMVSNVYHRSNKGNF